MASTMQEHNHACKQTPRQWAPNEQALVFGLRSRPELNGALVTLEEWISGSGRWGVRVQETTELLSLKPDNLRAQSLEPLDERESSMGEAEVKELKAQHEAEIASVRSDLYEAMASKAAAVEAAVKAALEAASISHASEMAAQAASAAATLSTAHRAFEQQAVDTSSTASAAEVGSSTHGSSNRYLFHGLVVRQLLQKYGFTNADVAKKLLPIANSAADATAVAKSCGTSGEDAEVFRVFFGPTINASAPTSTMEQLTASMLRLPDAAVEGTEVVHIPSFLSESEILQVFDAATRLSGIALPVVRNADKLASYPDDASSRYGANHVAINLHRAGHFAATCPALSRRILDAMRSQPSMYISPQIELGVRCIEFHSYLAGDGLSTKGHRDMGSILTMTILLSPEQDVKGGTFLTCDRSGRGEHVQHRMVRGDACLFHSEKMHNVAPVTAGVRHSLVIELWLRESNVKDRAS